MGQGADQGEVPSPPPGVRAALRSRGQQVRHMRTMSGLSIETKNAQPASEVRTLPAKPPKRPLLGGLYFTDLLVFLISLAANILRTCAVAEILDMVWFGIVYIGTSRSSPSVFRFRHQLQARWKLSKRQMRAGGSAPCFFSVFVLCGTRFVLSRFPYMLPRIALSQETAGPLVQWRTGGGVAHLVRPYDWADHEPSSQAPLPSPSIQRGFRAYWIRGERWSTPPTHPPKEGQRRAVLLFVHGGGFALGSVALYTEPILRVLGHVQKASSGRVHADCVAVEYDLAPGVRFPTPLLQCLRCYAHLVEVEHIPPEQIILCGDSAGGGLVMSMLLCLAKQAQDPLLGERDWSRLPVPARAMLISPVVDIRPQQAFAFTSLRQQAAAPDPAVRRALERRATSDAAPGALDFLAPEALMHYAQLYAGVLRRPRRARGPASWLCAYLEEQQITPGMMKPVSTAAHYLHHFLTHPLLRSAPRPARSNAVPKYTSTRSAVVPPDESCSDAIPRPHALYRTSALLGVHTSPQAVLATHTLLNPGLGDWSAIHLPRGIFVTWGRNEVLAHDIEAWVARVRLVWASQERDTALLETVPEVGHGGVHIWPFVWMYLAARQSERERGLRTLAHAVLGLYPDELCMSPSESEYDFSSPASMPSDYEEEHSADFAAQVAWEQELMRMGLRPP